MNVKIILLLQSLQPIGLLWRLDHISRATNVSSRSHLGWWSQRLGLVSVSRGWASRSGCNSPSNVRLVANSLMFVNVHEQNLSFPQTTLTLAEAVVYVETTRQSSTLSWNRNLISKWNSDSRYYSDVWQCFCWCAVPTMSMGFLAEHQILYVQRCYRTTPVLRLRIHRHHIR